MGEKKEVKVRLSTVVYLFIILVLVVALGVVYYFGFVANKLEDAKNNNIITSNTTNYKNIYDECEKQCKDVRYRRDLGEAAGYFIEDGVLYAGEKDLQNTHVNTTGINGKVKYVVPLNKQTGETVVLTEEGKLYKNKKDVGFYGNSFEVILEEYSFLEVLEIPNQEGLMFLSKEGKIISKEGTLYLDLFGENKPENHTEVGSNYVWEEYPEDFRKELDIWIGNRYDESMFSENTPVTLYSLSKQGFTWGGNQFSDYIGHYILTDGDSTVIHEWDSNYSQYDKRYGDEKVNLEKYTEVITYKTAIFNDVYLTNAYPYEETIEGMAKAQYTDLISEEKDYHYTDIPEDRKFYYEIPSMLVMNGNNTSEEAYKNNARAKKIKVILNNEKEFVFNLKDTNAVQVFDLNYKQNTIEKPVSITVEVLETYAGEKTEDIYISDIQFSINSNIPQGR